MNRADFVSLPNTPEGKAKRLNEKDGNYLVACTYDADETSRERKFAEKANCCNLLFLDLDTEKDGSSPAAPFIANPDILLKAMRPFNFAAYTTASSTAEKPRMRIVVDADNITLDNYAPAVKTIGARIGLKNITKESLTPNQPMICPSLFADSDADEHPMVATFLDGREFTTADVQRYFDFDEPPSAPQSGEGDDTGGLEFLKSPDPTATLEVVESALGYISPDCGYQQWFNVVCGLKHQFGGTQDEDAAIALFDSWSSNGTSYPGPDGTLKKWNSVSETPNGRFPVTIRSVLKKAAAAGWQDPRPKQQQAPQSEGSVKPFSFTHSSATEPCLATFDFIENVLIDASSVVVYGPSNLGKTAFALDLAAQVARGGLYRNKLAVEQGAVLYLTLEGTKLFANRVAALRREGKLPDDAPFYWTATEFNILSDEDPRRLIETIREVEREAGTSFKFVVIDTLARAMAGHDENSNEAMSQVAKSADRVQRATESCVALIHHTGKDASKGGRGGYALKCAADTEIELAAGEDGKTVVTVTKQRELEKLPPWAFSLKVVTLGVNKRGRPVTACVIDHHCEPVAPKDKANLFKKQKEIPSADSVFGLLPEGGTIKRKLFEGDARRKLDSTVRDLEAVLDRLIADGRVTEERVKMPSGQRQNHVSRHSCPKGASEASTHGDFPRVEPFKNTFYTAGSPRDAQRVNTHGAF